jgi:hypothetical protein
MAHLARIEIGEAPDQRHSVVKRSVARGTAVFIIRHAPAPATGKKDR